MKTARINNNVKRHKNWFSYYLHKYVGAKNDGFTFKLKNELTIKVPKRLMQTYKECFFDDTYFKGFPSNMNAHPITTIIDIGANVGYFSLSIFARNKNATVYAFEPMPNNYGQLEKYKNENPELNFQIFNCAVSNNGKPITLHYDQTDSFTTSATVNDKSNQPHTIEVTSVTLDDIINTHKINKVDLLKLDCEGSEYAILYSTSSTILDKIAAISMETHKSNAVNENNENLCKFLQNHNFKIKNDANKIWAWKTV